MSTIVLLCPLDSLIPSTWSMLHHHAACLMFYLPLCLHICPIHLHIFIILPSFFLACVVSFPSAISLYLLPLFLVTCVHGVGVILLVVFDVVWFCLARLCSTCLIRLVLWGQTYMWWLSYSLAVRSCRMSVWLGWALPRSSEVSNHTSIVCVVWNTAFWHDIYAPVTVIHGCESPVWFLNVKKKYGPIEGFWDIMCVLIKEKNWTIFLTPIISLCLYLDGMTIQKFLLLF